MSKPYYNPQDFYGLSPDEARRKYLSNKKYRANEAQLKAMFGNQWQLYRRGDQSRDVHPNKRTKIWGIVPL